MNTIERSQCIVLFSTRDIESSLDLTGIDLFIEA